MYLKVQNDKKLISHKHARRVSITAIKKKSKKNHWHWLKRVYFELPEKRYALYFMSDSHLQGLDLATKIIHDYYTPSPL